MENTRPTSLFLLAPSSFQMIYAEEQQQTIARLTQRLHPVLNAETWQEHPDICEQTEIIFSGWGMARADERFLQNFPRLRAIFYGAGSIKGFVTDELWDRGIVVCSANVANAVAVGEFTLAQIILSMKRAWPLGAATHRAHAYPPQSQQTMPGMYGSVVGLLSLGQIGRIVAQRLQGFDVKVIAYDPVIDPQEAKRLGVELCPLEEVFTRADVVSCHTPWLPQTEGLLTREYFLSMKPGSTFINTARGIIVDTPGLIDALRQRPDICALLDVVFPDPLPADNALYTLPNVWLTPHIAGSKGNECQRMGRTMVEELQRYLQGTPLKYAVTREAAALMAQP